MAGEADHYATLEVPSDATVEQIKRSYRRLALKYHPDKAPPREKDAATRKLKDINNAWGVLGDDDRRRVYDLQRGADMNDRFTQRRRARWPMSPRFVCTGRVSPATFSLASSIHLLRTHEFSAVTRMLARSTTPCLLFIHLGGSQRSSRAAEELEAAQKALGSAVRILGVDAEADAVLAERILGGSAEIPCLLMIARSQVQRLPPLPISADEIVQISSEMLPPLASVCTMSDFHQLLAAR